MKITFVLHHADMSGGVRVIAIYAKELAARGHDVTVVSTPWPWPSIRARLRAIVRRWPRPAPGGKWKSHLDSIDVPHHVLDSFRPVTDADVPDADIVVATWWETAEWVAALSAAKGAKAQLIQHYETWGGEKKRVDATWRLPIHRILISKWLVDLARTEFGDTNVSHVPNAVDMKQFDAPPRGRQTVPTVGLLYSESAFKGCGVSLSAIELASKQVPDLKLVAFGARDIWPTMPLPPGATYFKNPPQDKIREIYASCDVWLCGSTSEGFHLPPLEAMACRCPVVSTRVGGPVDTIIDGDNGYLVDVGDKMALTDRLVQVLTLSDAKWRAMSDSAYATACRYTWQDACDLLEKAFVGAIEQPSRSPARVTT